MNFIDLLKEMFGIGDYASERMGGTGAMRSDKWPAVRKQHLALFPTCAVCGTKGSFLKPNEVHHLQTFASRPEMELLEQNLLTGCRIHHQWFYHLGNFKSLNENAKTDAEIWSKKIQNRPKLVDGNWVYPNSLV